MHLGFKIVDDNIEVLYDLANISPDNFNLLYKFCRPCLWKDGKVIAYLDPSNFKKFEDGTYVSQQRKINVSSCEYMIEFPRMYYNFKSFEGIFRDKCYSFEISDREEEISYSVLSSAFNGSRKTVYDAFYVGAYEGHIDHTGKLRSIPGVNPTTGFSLNQALEAAKKTNENASTMDFEKFVYVLNLILMYAFSIGMKKIKEEDIDIDSFTGEVKEEEIQYIYRNIGLEHFLRRFSSTGTSENKGLFFEGSPRKADKKFGLENFLSNNRELIIPNKDQYSTFSIVTTFMRELERKAGVLSKYIPIKVPVTQTYSNPGCTTRLVAVKKHSDK